MPKPLFCGLPRGLRGDPGHRIGNQPSFGDGTKSSRSRRIAAKARWHHRRITIMARGDTELAYKMVAERDNETVKIERTSSFVIVAKARIWASEGWQVVITDADGKSYAPGEFDQLLAA
jgi:hypothetical protein